MRTSSIKMKLLLTSALLCLALQCQLALASRCLTVLNSKDCAKIQELGENICDKIDQVNSVIQETVYRSIEEGTSIIDSAIKYLLKLAVDENVKVPSPPQAPIETTVIFTLETKLLEATKAAVIDANKKMIAVMEKAVKQALGDDTVAKLILGTSPSRKRRSADNEKRTSVGSPSDLGNTLDGILERLSPEMLAILNELELHTKQGFLPVANLFADSVKGLFNGKVDIDFDQVKTNMVTYISETGKVVIQSIMGNLKEIIGSATRLLIDLSDRTAQFKSDKVKIGNALEPADLLVSQKVKAASTGTNEKLLLFKIKTAVGTLQVTYMQIKHAVSS